jgi:hypothetical protein
VKLKFNSKNFLSEFVAPILEINKSGRTPIFVEDDKLFSISIFDNNAVYLYNTYKPVSIEEPRARFNISLEKLKKALACVPTSDSPFVEVTVQDNTLSYKDEMLSANIRLIEDQLAVVPKFNVETFKKFNFGFKASMTKEKIMDIKRCMDFATETSKFYIKNNEGKLYIIFGDKLTNYNDDITVFLTDKFEGDIAENIYDISILKLTTRFNSDIVVNIADNGALLVKINQDNSELNYITTQLKK